MADLGALLGPAKRDDWGTPLDFFDRCSERWGPFDLDAAASHDNAKCGMYITAKADALGIPWGIGDCVWINPPYGPALRGFIHHAYNQVLQGYCKRIVALLPARTDTFWFHSWVMKAQEVVLIRGRITFVGASSPAPFPSMLAIWDWRLSGPVFSTMNAKE